MPSETGSAESLKILTTRSPLTPDDWFGLLESRRELIQYHLNQLSLQKLGHVLVEGIWASTLSLKTINPIRRREPEDLLEIQGVFVHLRPHHAENNPPNCGRYVICGIERWHARWLVGTLILRERPGFRAPKPELFTVKYLQDAREVVAAADSSPDRAWAAFGEKFKNLVRARLRLYEEVKGVAETVELEERLVSVVGHLPESPF